MYLLDSNIYINFYDRYYRKDFFPTFWSNFAGILNSSVVIPKLSSRKITKMTGLETG